MNRKKRKTLFEDSLDDVFLRPLKNNGGKLLNAPVQVENWFTICSSSKTMEYTKYFFEMRGNIIACKKEQDRKAIAYMDVLNSFMKKTEGTLIKGVLHYGIKFIKRRTYEELFHPDKEVVNHWFELLKRYCILTKFRCYFESIKVLGKGNFAKVFLVKRISDGKEFAVKVFNKSAIMQDPLEIKCLIYEIEMLRMINHYRVMRLYEMYEGENFIYCLVELYKGTDLLNAIVKKGSQPERKALTIVMQILEGLEYLHSKSIMHRDLKPENIIFKKSNDIDIGIVDLGFATLQEDYRKLFVRCGTPGYVAPEILNDMDYDCKTDVFSCGIIFYMILTGKIPFSGTSYKEIVQKNMRGKINFNFDDYKIKVSQPSKLTSYGPFTKNAKEKSNGETDKP